MSTLQKLRDCSYLISNAMTLEEKRRRGEETKINDGVVQGHCGSESGGSGQGQLFKIKEQQQEQEEKNKRISY